MSKVTNEQMKILINIIGAVETGGQVYGKQRYDDYTPAYTNSSAENSCTIGAFAEFRENAKALLNEILTTYPTTFRKYDNADIESDLKKSSWVGYSPAKNSAKAKAIQAIIGSSDGIKVQDSRIVKLLNSYIAFAEKQGVSDVDALFMCANFIHQGGQSACTRILKKTTKPYTLDHLYAACQTDTGNQVGAYKTRQQKVYGWLKEKVSVKSSNSGGSSMTENELRQKVVNTAIKYYGYNESNGSHKKIIDIYNGHKPLARSYKVTYTDAWCATFVSAISILCGLTDIMPTECGCGAMIELYQKLGRWVENDAYVPKAGDVIMYYWNDNGVGDCTGYPDHVGIVVSVSGSTIKVIEGNKSNAVGYRTLSVNGRYIRGYCIPNYASKATSSTPSQPQTSQPSTNSGSTSSSSGKGLNKTVKWDGYVTADELNVRTWAGTENGVCSFSPLKENTVVGVCDSVNAKDGVVWYYIKYNNKYGFVSSKYIQKKLSNNGGNASSNAGSKTVKVDYAASSNKSLAGTYKVTATDGLNLRAGAGTNKSIITAIPYGGKVTCYGYYTAVNGVKWYLVAYKTYTGFVSSQYLSK